MIKGFKHKGLEKFFTTGSKSGIQSKYANKIRIILGRLNVAICPKDVDLPGLRLHELTGNRQGTSAVKVDGNWRITFIFEGDDINIVDCEDYH